MGKKTPPPKNNPPKKQPKLCGMCGQPLGEHSVNQLAACQAERN